MTTITARTYETGDRVVLAEGWGSRADRAQVLVVTQTPTGRSTKYGVQPVGGGPVKLAPARALEPYDGPALDNVRAVAYEPPVSPHPQGTIVRAPSASHAPEGALFVVTGTVRGDYTRSTIALLGGDPTGRSRFWKISTSKLEVVPLADLGINA